MSTDIGVKIGVEGERTYRSALQAINAQTRALNAEMKQVATSFTSADSKEKKLAETNKVLQKQIDATKQKISVLNAQYEKQVKKLDELDTALEKAKQEFGENSEEAQKAQNAYNDQAKTVMNLKTKLDSAEAELNQMEKTLEDNTNKWKLMGEQLQETGEKLGSIGSGMKDVGTALTASITAPLAGVAAAAVKVGADFDAAMSQVSAVSGATGTDFERLRDKAQEMGAKTKFSATEAAEAMNYMAMAGWKTEDMLGGIEGIMNLAAASGEDLATTSDIVTDALTAFGLTANDSAHFANILAAASSNANTNVSMMGETFKYAAPVAGALGYSAEDVAEAIGLMANAGIKSSQAGTSLRTTLTSLTGDIKVSTAALGALTVSATNSDGSMRPLSEILDELRFCFSNMSESEATANAEMLVGKNAMSGFLALMNAAPADIEKLNTAISNCDETIDGCNGAAERMAATMQDNLTGQLTILQSTVEGIGIQISDILTPALSQIVSVVQNVATGFSEMDTGTKKAVLAIAGVAAAIGPVIAVAGTLVTAFSGAATAIGGVMTALAAGSGVAAAVGTALGALAGPIVIVVGLLAALVVAVVTHMDQIKAAVSGAVKAVSGTITTGFTAIKTFLSGIWTGMTSVLSGAWETIQNVIQVALMLIVETISTYVQIITLPWQFIWENCHEVLEEAWDAITKTLSGALNAISSTISNAWNAAANAVKPAVNAIKTAVSTAFNAIKTVTSTVWNGIKTTISTVVNAIKANVSTAFNNVKSTATNVFQSVKTAITTPLNAAKNTVSNILNSIKSKFSSIFSNVKNTVSNAISFIKGKLKFSWSLPKLKLPHFSVSGKFGLNPPSVPHFSIKWYRKAYDNAMLLSSPTIFGYGSGSFLGGGDGNGAEVVAGADTLMGMMQSAVNQAMTAQLDRIVELLEAMVPYLPEIAAQKQLVMDTGALVGATAADMNRAMAKMAAQGRRGR